MRRRVWSWAGETDARVEMDRGHLGLDRLVKGVLMALVLRR
jgi:hypothetical protein